MEGYPQLPYYPPVERPPPASAITAAPAPQWITQTTTSVGASRPPPGGPPPYHVPPTNALQHQEPAQKAPRPFEHIAILLLGLTGSGKSTFISLLADQPVAVGHTVESSTTTITGYTARVQGCEVLLIDTPGFDDTTRSDTEILSDIAISLSAFYQSPVKLVGVIYLQRISDTRMSGSSKKSIGMLERICGEYACPQLIIATTMWSAMERTPDGLEEGARREADLMSNPNFFGTLVGHGARFIRHDGSRESAGRIVSQLTAIPHHVVLDIQKQLVEEGLTLDKTPVGQFVQKELLEKQKKYEAELKKLEEELREVQDATTKSELTEERQQQLDLLSQLQRDKHGLRVDLPQLVERKNPQHASLLKASNGPLNPASQEETHELYQLRQQTEEIRKETLIQENELRDIRSQRSEERIRVESELEYQQKMNRLKVSETKLRDEEQRIREKKRKKEESWMNFLGNIVTLPRNYIKGVIFVPKAPQMDARPRRSGDYR